mgnify:FL=1
MKYSLAWLMMQLNVYYKKFCHIAAFLASVLHSQKILESYYGVRLPTTPTQSTHKAFLRKEGGGAIL